MNADIILVSFKLRFYYSNILFIFLRTQTSERTLHRKFRNCNGHASNNKRVKFLFFILGDGSFINIRPYFSDLIRVILCLWKCNSHVKDGGTES